MEFAEFVEGEIYWTCYDYYERKDTWEVRHPYRVRVLEIDNESTDVEFGGGTGSVYSGELWRFFKTRAEAVEEYLNEMRSRLAALQDSITLVETTAHRPDWAFERPYLSDAEMARSTYARVAQYDRDRELR
jgi:hypothetical protein